MTLNRHVNWLSDPTDRRVMQVRQLFLRKLEEQSKTSINYYDFLLVAKHVNFRFEESSHLMELRRFFFANQNMLSNKKLVSLLSVDEETMRGWRPDHAPDKIIIRFMIEGRIEAIQEVTNEDEDVLDSDPQPEPYSKSTKLEAHEQPTEGQEYQQKLTIILSIKVTEMMKKIRLLTEGLTEDDELINLPTTFENLILDNIPYEVFKKGVVGLIKKLEGQFSQAKLTVSEEDIRAIFTILDEKGIGQIPRHSIGMLVDETNTARKITKLYEGRVNRKMVKNTLFKLGKNSNSIQIYQVKNASVLEFKSIEDDLLQRNRSREKLPKRIPHFGPIKGTGLRQTPSRQALAQQAQRHNHSSLTTYKRPDSNLDRERQKIEHIIRGSKEQKKRTGNDTIANKLRKLFIHKVILPRQKLLEEEKNKYVQNKGHSTRLVVKLI